jgi:nucleotide-binding universal stress UspA family protein
MPFKSLLCVTRSGDDPAFVKRAIALAGEMNAYLSVLVVGIAPLPAASPYGITNADIWAREADESRDAAKVRGKEIEADLEHAGVSGGVMAHLLDQGAVATLVARFARYSDLTVVPTRGDDHVAFHSAVLNGALFESGRPVLLLPPDAKGFPGVKTAIIAWDASLEASKAVKDAIPVLQGCDAVKALLVDPVPSFEGHGEEPGADLAAYLARHGITVEVNAVPREGHATSDMILRFAADSGADLIIMGAYAHSRLRQIIFGGTTSTIIGKANVPVLMAH